MTRTKPTAAQAAALRRAADHPRGFVQGAGTVVRRALLDAGWAEKVNVPLVVPRSRFNAGVAIDNLVPVITDAGRAAVGLPCVPVVDLDEDTS